MLNLEAYLVARAGKMNAARALIERTVELANRLGLEESAAAAIAGQAMQEAYVGERERAVTAAGSAMDLFESRDALPFATFALGFSGEAAEAERWLDAMASRYPRDTLLNEVWIPATRAAIALHDGRPRDGLSLLENARKYERAQQEVIYLRALLLQAAGSYDEAVAEFDLLQDLPDVNWPRLERPLALLGRGRVLAAAGQTAEARIAYQEFLDRWAEADEDVPILIEAKAELEALP